MCCERLYANEPFLSDVEDRPFKSVFDIPYMQVIVLYIIVHIYGILYYIYLLLINICPMP